MFGFFNKKKSVPQINVYDALMSQTDELKTALPKVPKPTDGKEYEYSIIDKVGEGAFPDEQPDAGEGWIWVKSENLSPVDNSTELIGDMRRVRHIFRREKGRS
jgi:hypothetical protein